MAQDKVRVQIDVDRQTYEAIQYLKGIKTSSGKNKYGRSGGEVVDRALKIFVLEHDRRAFNFLFGEDVEVAK